MFKKISWVVALLLALTMIFVSCRPAEDPTLSEEEQGGEITEVFNLQEAIEGAAVGMFANDADFEAALGSLNFLRPAGAIGSQVEVGIVADGLRINTPFQNWAGVDLHNPGMEFRAGDVIVIEGRTITAAQVLLNINHAGWDPLDGWNPQMAAGIDFSRTFTLTAGDVAKIRSASPPAIRIRANAVGSEWVITQITVTGLRGGVTGPECLCEDSTCDCDCAEECMLQCPGCEPAAFPITATPAYVVPVATADNEFYLNLNTYTSNTMTGSGPDAAQGIASFTPSADSVKFILDRNDQRINFTLTTDQIAAIQDVRGAGVGIGVVIDGTAGPYTMRYGLANPTEGSSWNATGLTTGLLSGANLATTLDPANSGNANADAFSAFMIQLRMPVKSLFEIKSIKIVLPVLQVVNLNDIPIAAPVPGEVAQATIAQTAQYTGTIAWTPALLAGNIFDTNVAYTATVTLAPRNKFWTYVGHSGQFTSGAVNGSIVSWTTDVPQRPRVAFAFPATVHAVSFGDAEVNVQMFNAAQPPVLVDIPASVKTNTELTATYDPGDTGPAAKDVTILWQMQGTGGWTTAGTGITHAPAAVGTWRVRVTASGYLPLISATFTTFSPVMAGELDAALNATFTREGTKIWSFADWVDGKSGAADNGSPLIFGGSTAYSVVSNGINVSNRANDWDTVEMVYASAKWGHNGIKQAPLNVDPSAGDYRITFYGFFIGTPPAQSRAVIQGTNPYPIVAQSDVITAADGSFKVVWNIDEEGIESMQSFRISTNNTAPFRITLIEIELLDDDE